MDFKIYLINTVDYFDQNYKLNYKIKNYKTIKMMLPSDLMFDELKMKNEMINSNKRKQEIIDEQVSFE